MQANLGLTCSTLHTYFLLMYLMYSVFICNEQSYRVCWNVTGSAYEQDQPSWLHLCSWVLSEHQRISPAFMFKAASFQKMKTNVPLILTMYNCALQVFPLHGVKRTNLGCRNHFQEVFPSLGVSTTSYCDV